MSYKIGPGEWDVRIKCYKYAYIKRIGEGECVMSKFAQILHDQLSSEIGGVVRLLLRSGKELPGVIDQVDEDFVVLKRRGSRATTIVLDEIAAFDFPDGTMPVEESERWSLSHPVLNAAPTVPLDQPLPKLGIEVFKRLEELTAQFERKMQQAR